MALVSVLAAAIWNPDATGSFLHQLARVSFFLAVALRVAALVLPRRQEVSFKDQEPSLPPYTVIAALKDEAAVVPQLVARLSALNYPGEHLRGFIVVEAADTATIAAVQRCAKPDWLELLIAPPGSPTTKPRALNIALSRVEHGLLTVYDAEDEPHPQQLREAAARFAAGPARLACLQAPLRIRTVGRRPTWMERQFAGEYAALFEMMLPLWAGLGMPLPLGGTSNHFRVDVLRSLGGWDPWNVTEDADLGFRLWRAGYRTGMLTLPTWESPPGGLRAWLPQRTRWLKGYMQTWGVHMRRPLPLGWRGLLGLQLTIGLTIASATLQAAVICWLAAVALTAALAQVPPQAPVPDMVLACLGWISASACCLCGSRRAGTVYGLSDALTGPVYWSLLSIAQAHAVWRLIRQPFHWDKTPHTPDTATGRPEACEAMPSAWPPASPLRRRRSAPAPGMTTPS